MDIGSLGQGLQKNTVALAVPAAQGEAAESGGDEFDDLLRSESVSTSGVDLQVWQAWAASAQATSVIVPMVNVAQSSLTQSTAVAEGENAGVLEAPVSLEGAGQPAIATSDPSDTLVRTEGSGQIEAIALSVEAVTAYASENAESLLGNVTQQGAIGLGSAGGGEEQRRVQGQVGSENPPLPAINDSKSTQATVPLPGVTVAAPRASTMPEQAALFDQGLSASANGLQAEGSERHFARPDGRAEVKTEGRGAASQSALNAEPPKALGYWRVMLAESAEKLQPSSVMAAGGGPVDPPADVLPLAQIAGGMVASQSVSAQAHTKEPDTAQTAAAGPQNDAGLGAALDVQFAERDSRREGADENAAKRDGNAVPVNAKTQDQAPRMGGTTFLTQSIAEMSPAMMASAASEAFGAPMEVHHMGSAREASFQALQAGQPTAERPEVLFRAAAIEQVQSESGVEMTEIRLDPEELGRLRITLEGEGEALRIRVEVERPETLDLLRRNVERLAETLREAGYSQSDMQFSTWSGQRQKHGAQPAFQAALGADRELEPPAKSLHPAVSSSRSVAAADGLNLRL